MARFLITTLAEYQTEFWREVGLELTRRGHQPTFLSFDDRSIEMLRARGLKVYSATRKLVPQEAPREALLAIIASTGLTDVEPWLEHERHAFGISDETIMLRKLANAVLSARAALDDLSPDGAVTMVQELGGFLSVIGSFLAARQAGFDNWFIEPSFFRGRLLFLRNSFAAFDLPVGAQAEPQPEMIAYLDDTTSNSAIVIPQKDRHQYRDAWQKVVNSRNLQRLIEKSVDKFWHRKHQEFGYLGHHVRQHVAMVLASRRLRGHYTTLEALGRFLYYPLHVPGDMALTLRSPAWLDQLGLIDRLCRAAPPGVTIAVKEHPAMIGAIGAAGLIAMLQAHSNFALLDPSANNYAVLNRAAGVITVNSKSGAEAGLVGRNVLVLGDAFYRNAPFARSLPQTGDLKAALAELLEGSQAQWCSADATSRFFAALWPHTHPGELYVNGAAAVARFTDSLLAATQMPGTTPALRPEAADALSA